MAGGVGYVKLWRAFLDSEQMSDDWLCRLFVWCILRANFEPSKFKGVNLSPGQFVTGRISAAAELQVSPSKWYRGIERLAQMGAIKISANSNWTTLTLCNWQTYQSGDNKSEQPADSERTAGDTTSGQRVIQRADTDKEGKKVRRKQSFEKPSLQEVLEYCSERNSPVEAQEFLDYQESSGWMVGTKPMKDWRAAIRTYENLLKKRRQEAKPKPRFPTMAELENWNPQTGLDD